MSANNFDFEDYVKFHGIDVKKGPWSERIIDCVFCGKKKHLYFNIDKNLFDCKVCGESGNHIRFLMFYEGISYEDALEKSIEYTEVNIKNINHKIKKIMNSLEYSEEFLSKNKIIIKPPGNSIEVSKKKYPKFFARRGYEKDIIIPMCLRVCENGYYGGRIIFPFTCNGHQSFVAYASNPYMKPKTLNPLGSNNEDLIFGYDLFPNAHKLVIVEGITDSLRLWHFGFPANALLGNKLTDSQIFLLNNHSCEEVIFCYDGDMSIDLIEKRISKAENYMSKKISIALITDEEKDPDKLTYDDFLEIYDKRINLMAIRLMKVSKLIS